MQVVVNKVKDIDLPNPKKSTKPIMQQISLYSLSKIQKRIESNIAPANKPLTVELKKGTNTLRDNGHLRASLHARHSAVSATVATNVPYARIHNEGGVITPKNAKYLTIPAIREFAKKSKIQGVKKTIEEYETKGYVFFRPYRRGGGSRSNVIMFKKNKGKGKARVAFYLKKKVVIPKRQFMYLTKMELHFIDKMIGEFYEK